MKVHKNQSSGSRVVPRRETDMMKLIFAMLQTHLKVNIKRQVVSMYAKVNWLRKVFSGWDSCEHSNNLQVHERQVR